MRGKSGSMGFLVNEKFHHESTSTKPKLGKRKMSSEHNTVPAWAFTWAVGGLGGVLIVVVCALAALAYTDLDGDIKSVDGRLEKLDTKVEALDAKVDNLSTVQSQMVEQLKAIEAILAGSR